MAHWTTDRIQGAVPRDLVLVPSDPDRGPAREATGLATTAAGDVTGAQWTAGGAILKRSGLVLFTMDGIDYSCTGSTIQDAADPAYSLVITAAHCAYDEVTDQFATNWVFIPAWDLTPAAGGCSSTTYGCWAARALVVHAGWANEGGLTVAAVQHDFAVAVVGPGGKTGTQLDALGAYPVRIDGVDPGDRLHAFGYPAAPPYDGTQLVYCLGSAGVEPAAGSWGLTCDMTSGASGGPWLYGSSDPAGGSGEIASVTSYRILNDPGLYGPRFGSAAATVVARARAATPDSLGIDGLVVPPFTDIANSTFRDDIDWLYFTGITTGCTPTRYCPDASVTRGQMASFLVRALDLPSTTTDFFTDDNGSTHEVNINRVAAAGITSGCTPTTYCPDADVSRAQMASFLARAFALPSTTTDFFTDDNGTTHEANINRVAAAGITKGCTATTYCPKADVSRGQMAAFLHRALTR
jgi:hypothetical protein